jgi:hypothetical protein
MELDKIKDLFEILSFIATIFGMTALFLGYRSYKTTVKQLSFEIVNSCTSRFHAILKDLKHAPTDIDNIEAYIGLCNEELFYFKYDYLPKDVVLEWLAGMKDTVPHFVNNENVNQSPKCVQHIQHENGKEIDLLYSYQRLKFSYTFESMELYEDLSKDTEKFVKHVYQRLKIWKSY